MCIQWFALNAEYRGGTKYLYELTYSKMLVNDKKKQPFNGGIKMYEFKLTE